MFRKMARESGRSLASFGWSPAEGWQRRVSDEFRTLLEARFLAFQQSVKIPTKTVTSYDTRISLREIAPDSVKIGGW